MEERFEIAGFDHYADVIQAELERRQRNNPNFSMRAFARLLSVSPSTLSEITRKKHGISRQLAEKFADKLGYRTNDRSYFLNLFDFIHSPDVKAREDAYNQIQDYRSLQKHRQIKQSEFQLISHWYNLAILELVKLDQFRFDYDWIGEQLGISTLEAMSAVNRLKQLGLLKVSKGKVELSKATETSAEADTEALNRFFRQCLEKALDAVRFRGNEDRYVGVSIVAVDEEDLPELRRKIKAFKNDLARQMASKEKKTKLYCIAGLAFDLVEAVKGRREHVEAQRSGLN